MPGLHTYCVYKYSETHIKQTCSLFVNKTVKFNVVTDVKLMSKTAAHQTHI